MGTAMEYLKANWFRLVEILFVIVGVFWTMQANIESQGEMIATLQEQQRLSQETSQQTARVLQDLTVMVARIRVKQESLEKEIDRLDRDLSR